MATFWATFEKIGYFLFHHLVTLEGREREREREKTKEIKRENKKNRINRIQSQIEK